MYFFLSESQIVTTLLREAGLGFHEVEEVEEVEKRGKGIVDLVGNERTSVYGDWNASL